MQNATASGRVAPNSAPSPASVPISLYREVSAELQNSQALVNSLTLQNQQLSQQNQELQRQLDRIIQAVQEFQQTVQQSIPGSVSFPPSLLTPINSPGPQPHTNVESHEDFSTSESTLPFNFPEPEPTTPKIAEKLFTEEPQLPYRIRSQTKKATDLGGVWLAIAIMLIIVGAFGAGYWVVRPLLIKK